MHITFIYIIPSGWNICWLIVSSADMISVYAEHVKVVCVSQATDLEISAVTWLHMFHIVKKNSCNNSFLTQNIFTGGCLKMWAEQSVCKWDG